MKLEDCLDCAHIYDYCKLIEAMIQDIQHLELEVVSCRYVLSGYLPEPDAMILKSEMVSNLAGRYTWSHAYETCIYLLYSNNDPLEDESHVNRLNRLANGLGTTDITRD